MRATTRLGAALLAACAIAGDADAQKPLGGRAAGISTQWYKPAQSNINDLDSAAHGHGVYGFIYNSSITPHGDYGAYNWCNMPHVRRTEYVVPPKEYELQYVELVGAALPLFVHTTAPMTWQERLYADNHAYAFFFFFL